jgi:hypothetical protein
MVTQVMLQQANIGVLVEKVASRAAESVSSWRIP